MGAIAYTTDRTWIVGEVVTAAQHNTYVRDNLKWLSTDAPCARVYSSADFSHTTSGSFMALTFDLERFDNATMHDTVTNNERLTIPSGGDGKYLVGGCVDYAANATGVRLLGVGLSGIATFVGYSPELLNLPATACTQSVSTFWSIAAAAWFALGALQSSGGTLAMPRDSSASNEFWCAWQRI